MRKLRDLTLGALLGLFLTIGTLFYLGHLESIPYSDVTISEVSLLDSSNIYLDATFKVKEGCKFERLEVFGSSLGHWSDPLWWEDTTGKKGDRIKGYHSFVLEIQGDPAYTIYEVRTEHDCDGKRKEEIFHRFTYEDLQ